MDGKDIFALKDEELTIFRRRKIGFVFQSFNLVPVLSVYENIVLPLQLDGKTVDNAFIGEIAEALGLKEKIKRAAKPAFGRTAAARGDRAGTRSQTGDFISR